MLTVTHPAAAPELPQAVRPAPAMSRDELAYGAMIGMLGNSTITEGMKFIQDAATFPAAMAVTAYKMADAMLAQSKIPPA